MSCWVWFVGSPPLDMDSFGPAPQKKLAQFDAFAALSLNNGYVVMLENQSAK